MYSTIEDSAHSCWSDNFLNVFSPPSWSLRAWWTRKLSFLHWRTTLKYRFNTFPLYRVFHKDALFTPSYFYTRTTWEHTHRRIQDANKYTSLKASPGHCGWNVQIYIIDKCISDLFIKPTTLWAMQRRSQSAVGIPWAANQSHLNGANMNRPSRGSYRRQAVHCVSTGTSWAFYPELLPWLDKLSFRLTWWDWAAKAVITIPAIICSGVFALAVIRQKHNIFSPQP